MGLTLAKRSKERDGCMIIDISKAVLKNTTTVFSFEHLGDKQEVVNVNR